MSLLCNLPASFTTATKPANSPPERRLHSRRPTVSFFSSPRTHALPISPPSHYHSSNSTRTSAALTSDKAVCYPSAETVEHVVLFKMKDNCDDDILCQELNNLKNLPGVIYITAGYTFDQYSSNPSLDFPIFLHSRHRNKQDLDTYMHCDEKLRFTNTYTELYYEDYAVLDWTTFHPQQLPNPSVGNALRATFFEMKDEGWGAVYDKIGAALGDSVAQQTFGGTYVGRSYRPQTKGFSVASLGIFHSIFDVQKLGTAEDFGKKVQGEVNGAIDNIMVLDYIVKELYANAISIEASAVAFSKDIFGIVVLPRRSFVGVELVLQVRLKLQSLEHSGLSNPNGYGICMSPQFHSHSV